MLRETLFSRSNRMLMVATAVSIPAESALAERGLPVGDGRRIVRAYCTRRKVVML